MALWNQKCLPAPPTNTYKANTIDLDLVKLRNVLQDCMRHFKNEDFMTREAALLSRILYRMKMKFRSSKEFKSLEKISHSLKIYLSANMGRDLKNIFDIIPSKYQTDTYLPTRNMLSYILVRIQGLVKLMERVYDTCQVAASEINTRLFLGHFWKQYIILFALVSRLYILVKFNTKQLCELYGKLLPHVNKLKNIGRNWLPEGYSLPSDLREWLEVKWVYEEEFIDLTQDLTLHPSILDFLNLVDDDDDDDDVQFCDEYVLIDEEDINIATDFRRLEPIEETFTRNRMRGFSINEDDIGEDIADIIQLNETSMDNIDLRDIQNNEQINAYVTDTHQTSDLEDVGEDISCIRVNKKGEFQVLILDETGEDIADISQLNKTSMDNTDLIDIQNNEQINFYVTDANQTSDHEDVGEDISCIRVNKKGEFQVLILDETGEDIADISQLNKTSMDNTDLIDIQNNGEINSYVIDANQTSDHEDVGEDISCKLNKKGEFQVINMDKTGNHHLSKDRIITKVNTKMVQSTKECTSKSKSDMKHNKINKITTDSVINLVDDSMIINDGIIVIPETPLKNVQDNLNDHSVIILNDTVNNTLVPNTIDKKKKRKSKSRKKSLKSVSSTNDNSIENVMRDKKNKSISLNSVTFPQTLKDSNNLTSQNASSQEESTPQHTNAKRKIRESNNYPNENDSAAKKRKPDKDEVSAGTFNNKKLLINQKKNLKQFNVEGNLPQHGVNKVTEKIPGETEKINQSTRHITNSSNNFNCVAPVNKEIICEENTFELLVDKRKKGKNKIQHIMHKDKIELQEREQISPRMKNITKSLGNSFSITPIKEKIITEENHFKLLVDKGKKDKNKKKSNQHNNKIELQEEREKISTRTKSITKSLDNFVSITSIKEKRTEENNFEVNTLEVSNNNNNKRKRGKKKKQSNDEIKIKQGEKISPSGNNITESEKSQNNDGMVMVTPSIKRNRAKNANMKSRIIDYERYNYAKELGAKNINKTKNKNKNNTYNLTETKEANSSKWKKETIVRLTLVNVMPNVTGNQNDYAGPSNTKKKSPENINLVPRLDTPLNAILNIDSPFRASTSGKTPGQTVRNMPLEMTDNKELENTGKGKRRKSRDRKRRNKRHTESPSSSLVEKPEIVDSSNPSGIRQEENHSGDERISKFFRNRDAKRFFKRPFSLSKPAGESKPNPTPKKKKAKKKKVRKD